MALAPPLKRWAQKFLHKRPCPSCGGSRLKPTAHQFKIAGATLPDVVAMDLRDLVQWSDNALSTLGEREAAIAQEPLQEISSRLGFLLDMGLDYLTLDRPARSLSGRRSPAHPLGHPNRVQTNWGLVHPRRAKHWPFISEDNQRLIDSLKTLRDVGNTVIVVEHDEDMMRQADHLIDIGPGAGKHGGHVVAEGPPSAHLAQDSVTAQFFGWPTKHCHTGETPQRKSEEIGPAGRNRSQPQRGRSEAAFGHLHLHHRSQVEVAKALW